jgi:hypothetical protein
LLEVVGKADKLAPEQMAATAVKVGITFAFTVMVIVAVVAHCPAVGVKVYSVVAVLFNAGDQVPVISFVEVVGKADKVAPEQMAATAVKVGVTFAFTAKLPAEVPVPAGVVTATVPAAIDSAGRVAVIWVLLFTVKLATAIPFTVTAVAPEKSAPVMIKVDPPQPSVMAVVPSLVKALIVGAVDARIVKFNVAVLQPSIILIFVVSEYVTSFFGQV